MLLFLACFVAVSAFLALSNWRLGVFCCIAVALLQDPIRKVTPGTPPFLTAAFIPIYAAMFAGLMASERTNPLGLLRRTLPRVETPLVLFTLALMASFAQSLSTHAATTGAAALGLFSYLGAFPAVLLGYRYLRRGFDELDSVLIWFVVLTTVMLIGVPLEAANFKFSEPWLGTIAMQGEWRRWFGTREWVKMISGFYRSPEIMGWHAMFMTVVSLYLMLRRTGLAPLWMATASWGAYAVFMCGRRKMYLMLLMFVATLIWRSGGWRRSRLIAYCLVAITVIVPVVVLLVDDRYIDAAQSGLNVAGTKATEKGLGGPIWLIPIVGPFGFGVGTKTQGAQHLGITGQVPSVEGGLEKVLVELGWVGLSFALLVALTVLRAAWNALRVTRKSGWDDTPVNAIFALLAANAAAFLVAFQFMGDPFVVFMLGFLLGILLSAPRVIHRYYANAVQVYQDESSPELVAANLGRGAPVSP